MGAARPTPTSEENRRYELQRRIDEARGRKVTALVEALRSQCGGQLPAPEVVEALSPQGWQALAVVAGCRPASPETQAAVIRALRARHAEQAVDDPFDGIAARTA